MITSRLSLLRTTKKLLFPLLIAVTLIEACGVRPHRAGEIAQPATQPKPPTRVLQPTDILMPVSSTEPTNAPTAATLLAEPTLSSISACALISKAEAEAAVGSLVGEPVELDFPPLYGCDFKASGINKIGVNLTVFSDATQANDAFQMEIDLNSYEEVSGIGDRALRPEIGDIDVVKGRYDIIIAVVSDADRDARFEVAKKLALAALKRLP